MGMEVKTNQDAKGEAIQRARLLGEYLLKFATDHYKHGRVDPNTKGLEEFKFIHGELRVLIDKHRIDLAQIKLTLYNLNVFAAISNSKGVVNTE